MTAYPTLLLLLPPAMLACLNVQERGVSLNGESHPADHVGAHLRDIMEGKAGDTDVREKFHLTASTALSKEAEAVDKILHGDVQSGLTLLTKIESENPGNYSIAANIGTAFELVGDNTNALKWIKEGVSRNSASHDGTEWLHVLILEAKVAASDNSGGPLPARMLDLPERMAGETRVNVGGMDYHPNSIRKALHHQLSERVFFVKPKDPYVADLLYSYALVEANLGTTVSALQLLQLAREYGFPDEALLLKHEKKYQRFATMDAFKGQLTFYVLLIGGAFLVIYFIRRLVSLCRD